MWQTFFRICDFLCSLIPIKQLRHRLRRDQLYDWRRKYDALRATFPELNFHHTKMIKGGWNIGFIIDKKYVFKIRKAFDKNTPTDKIMNEKRITDALRGVSPVLIPKIDIIHTDEYTFFKYDFIPGRNMNTYSLRQILKHKTLWGQQLGEFIYYIHNARPEQIDDMRGDRVGDGWNHNDICNNVIIDTKTQKIVALIDWEYSGWGTLETEMHNTTAFSKKIKESGIGDVIRTSYLNLAGLKNKPH